MVVCHGSAGGRHPPQVPEGRQERQPGDAPHVGAGLDPVVQELPEEHLGGRAEEAEDGAEAAEERDLQAVALQPCRVHGGRKEDAEVSRGLSRKGWIARWRSIRSARLVSSARTRSLMATSSRRDPAIGLGGRRRRGRHPGAGAGAPAGGDAVWRWSASRAASRARCSRTSGWASV